MLDKNIACLTRGDIFFIIKGTRRGLFNETRQAR